VADGITEEIVAQFGNLDPKRLGVIARTSAMRGQQERSACHDDINTLTRVAAGGR
jgi:TolB-like protein